MSVANPYENDRFEARHQRLSENHEQLKDQYLDERPEQRIYLKPKLDAALADLQDCRLQQVRRYQLNHAYDEAGKLLQLMLVYEPEHKEALKQQAELNALEPLRKREWRLRRKILRIKAESFKEISQQVADALRRVEVSEPYQDLLDEVENLQNDADSIEEFVHWWNMMGVPSATQATARGFDSHGLGSSIVRGNKVLFLGGNVVNTGQEYWSEHQLTRQLAQKANYLDFRGTLSAIAEYFVEEGGLGRPCLLEQMLQGLPPQSLTVPLYQVLAGLSARLVLISASYDGLLEKAFKDGGKPFITLTPVLPSNQHGLGKLRVHYSEAALVGQKPLPEQGALRSKEEISSLPGFEKYSLVYKLRGQCDPGWPEDALALTESDYFRFANYAEQMIPDCIISALNRSGCLFVGYNPEQWEERLLVDALLRRSEYKNLQVVGKQTGRAVHSLEDVFWRKQRVQQYALSVDELTQLLQAEQTA